MFDEIKITHPDYLNAISSRLQAMEGETTSEERNATIALARSFIAKIDTAELLKFYGTKSDQRSDATKIRSQMDKQKQMLVDAYARLGTNLIMEMIDKSTPVEDEITQVDDISKQILQFYDITDGKCINFYYHYYRWRGYHGLATRLAIKILDDKYNKENEDKLISCYNAMGWHHASKHLESNQLTRFPPHYSPF